MQKLSYQPCSISTICHGSRGMTRCIIINSWTHVIIQPCLYFSISCRWKDKLKNKIRNEFLSQTAVVDIQFKWNEIYLTMYTYRYFILWRTICRQSKLTWIPGISDIKYLNLPWRNLGVRLLLHFRKLQVYRKKQIQVAHTRFS